MLSHCLSTAILASTENSEGGNAFAGFVCLAVILVLCYFAGKGSGGSKGYNEVSVKAVRPHK